VNNLADEVRVCPADGGRTTQRKDWQSGEEVEYQYDSLQRLSSAATTGPEWGQSFGYDGFGNLLSETVTKGSAPSLRVTVNPATNRITNQGTSYDANGNLTAMPGLTMTYDVANRLTSATQASTDHYFYDPAGRRVFRNDLICFHGVDGSLLGEYTPAWPEGYSVLESSVYFGKRLLWKGAAYYFFTSGTTINDDRLGSVVYDGANAPKYFPYGDEPVTTEQNRPKFATYFRDGSTALDYAQQRYYASTLGRFTSPDRSGKNESLANPLSFNRYAYVNGDPVNSNDPSGESEFSDICMSMGSESCRQLFESGAVSSSGMFPQHLFVSGFDSYAFWQSSGVEEEMRYSAMVTSAFAADTAKFFTAQQISASVTYETGGRQDFSFDTQYLTNLSTITATLAAASTPGVASLPGQPLQEPDPLDIPVPSVTVPLPPPVGPITTPPFNVRQVVNAICSESPGKRVLTSMTWGGVRGAVLVGGGFSVIEPGLGTVMGGVVGGVFGAMNGTLYGGAVAVGCQAAGVYRGPSR
jgi:RHS repeat-associated protein